MRIRAGFEVPDLDAALSAAREEDTAIELFKSEAADACRMRANVVGALIDASRIQPRGPLAVEAMLRRGRKRAQKLCRDGAGQVSGAEVARLTGKEVGQHSSEVNRARAGRQDEESRDAT
jgi:hypothetical protein